MASRELLSAGPFDKLPGRVFLDTTVVNFWLDHGEEIHDGVSPPPGTRPRVAKDVDALKMLAWTGQRAQWQLAVSPLTFLEVTATRHVDRESDLRSWFWDVWHYWRDFLLTDPHLPRLCEAEEMRLQILSSAGVRELKDANDKILLCDAVVYGCDMFCTRDWSTILKYRANLSDYPIPICTPSEWWSQIQPWSGIWL